MNRELLKKRRINMMRKAFVLSVVAVGLLLWVHGNALAKFKDSNFKGRYVCSGSSDQSREQSVMILIPDGKGKFESGKKILVSNDFSDSTLASGCTSKAGVFMDCPCVYTLSGSSSYSISGSGAGTATLAWTASGSNDPDCPATAAGNFDGLSELWLLGLSPGGSTAQVTSNNNGFEGESAVGSCTRGPVQ